MRSHSQFRNSLAREIAKNEKVKLRNNVISKVKNNNTQSKLNKEERAENVKNVYKEQLDLYAEALERIFPLPVKEKYLYSFRLNQAIEV